MPRLRSTISNEQGFTLIGFLIGVLILVSLMLLVAITLSTFVFNPEAKRQDKNAVSTLTHAAAAMDECYTKSHYYDGCSLPSPVYPIALNTRGEFTLRVISESGNKFTLTYSGGEFTRSCELTAQWETEIDCPRGWKRE